MPNGHPSLYASITTLALLLLLSLEKCEPRYHYHKHHSSSPKFNSGSQISLPPASAPAEPPSMSKDINTTRSEHRVFDVRSYGAIGDGSSNDAQAFRAAWKAACMANSSVILVPSDGVFMVTSTIFSGPCRPGLVLQVSYPVSIETELILLLLEAAPSKEKARIGGISPASLTEGLTEAHYPGLATALRFFMSYNVTVGRLRIRNSPQFHIKFDGCDGVHIEGLSISSPSFSPNTDGIHIENTKSVAIYDSIISNGDDCISIGPSCSNVDIANVTCGPSHGISIGSLGVHNSQACVTNVKVRNARIRDSDNGLRIKTWQGGTGSVSGISFEDIAMENVRNCIIVDQYYCLSKQCLNQTSAVWVTDVAYSNIKGTYDVRSAPVHFACSDTVACTNITMSEVELLPHEGEMVDDPFCWNAYGVLETLTIPPIYCLQEGQPQSLALEDTPAMGCS
ncbi:hypothetical protein ZIOFF_037665 [Zingiber officinale]|uniref:Polygalacturonase n=1 Tax=Zingiber officinale TaxID=94328 RepID=A0A8J5GGB0_ZINOF|nr:hypothetical protein ZIOFF_037665 [Zingiber officinale]